MSEHTQASTGQEVEAITVRGFIVRRRDGMWYAHCIDLTIDALAPTPQEAIEKISSATVSYLNWATERGEPLMRPSPLRFRLRYYVLAVKDRLRAFFRRPPSATNSGGRTFHQPVLA